MDLNRLNGNSSDRRLLRPLLKTDMPYLLTVVAHSLLTVCCLAAPWTGSPEEIALVFATSC